MTSLQVLWEFGEHPIEVQVAFIVKTARVMYMLLNLN